LGVELDKRHSKKRLISEIEEVLDNSWSVHLTHNQFKFAL
jgi:hypothetical protein